MKKQNSTSLLTWLKFAVQQHSRSLSLFGGLTIVTIWTLIRHFRNGTNFDVVGQIGLVRQWTHGEHLDTLIGPTNYILKMPLYWVLNFFDHVDPHMRLLAIALLFNLATFWLLFIVIERMLVLYKISDRAWFYVAFVWLATISGRVYWLDYANSRNLESVAGIVLLYLVLLYGKTQKARLLAWIAVLGTFTFFADPLQLYLIAAPTCLWLIIRFVISRNRQAGSWTLRLIASLFIAVIASKLLVLTADKFLPITFLATPLPVPDFTLSNILQTVRQTIQSSLTLFDSHFLERPYGPNSLRQLVNFLVLGTIIFSVIRVFKKTTVKRPEPTLLLVGLILWSYLIYTGSGQALQLDTSRYLIMVPIFLVMLVALLGHQAFSKRISHRLLAVWLSTIIVSTTLLIGALALSWPTRYDKDRSSTQLQTLLRDKNFDVALAAPNVAIPADYFSDHDKTALPISCLPEGSLRKIKLFYDEAAFSKLQTKEINVPVLIGGTGCSREIIVQNFGNPLYEIDLLGSDWVPVYKSSQIKL